MTTVRLKPGDRLIVVAQDPSLAIDNTLPGPDLGLGIPTHPIVLPPDPTQPLPIDPGWSGGVAPPGQEGGAPRPTHPIVLPPPGEIPPPITPPDVVPGWEKKIAWTPATGWVVVAVPTGEHVTPSKRR